MIGVYRRNGMVRLWHRSRLAIVLSLGLLLSVAKEVVAADAPAKPNIVLIVADDVGWKDVGYHGSEIDTPNIDKLAKSGAMLEQFYVMPVCSPTRACLLTGRYPMRYGLQVSVVRPWAQYGLPLEERTLPQALKENGYDTGIVGKWHLGHFDKRYLPLQRGFDHHYGHYNGAIDYFKHDREGGLDWHRDGKPVREEGYATELLGAEAVRMISTHDTRRPLFLYIPFNAPHTPLQAPDENLAKYAQIKNEKRRRFATMFDCVDKQIGRILAALEERHLSENTIVIFHSDNGGAPGVGGNNGDLRASKGTLYQGGLRVPCCIAWPGKIKAGTVVNSPIHVSDWYPTLLSRAGASLDQPLKLDGVDVWPALAEDKPLPQRDILLNVTPFGGALLSGDWKLVLNGDATGEENLGVRKGARKKAAAASKKECLELFQLSKDPCERQDLAAEQPEKLKVLRDLLEKYAQQAVPPKAEPVSADYKAPEVWGD